MRNKLIKILSILIIAFLIICVSNTIFAATGKDLTEQFDGSESKSFKSDGESIIDKTIGPVLSVVRIIATGVAVIMITYLGIKYMSAAPNEKADVKKQLITFTIGAVVVIGTTSILDIIKETATGVFK